VLETHHPLIQYFNRFKKPLERTELESMIHERPVEERAALEDILAFLKSFKADASIPSFLQLASGERVLKSILFLGPQKSDEPYRAEDLDVFFTLAQESAIAIENARLFDEAVQRTKELKEMNRELADTNERLQVTQASLIVAEKNATMVGMAKAIAHEVNNPLSTVSGRATYISRIVNNLSEIALKMILRKVTAGLPRSKNTQAGSAVIPTGSVSWSRRLRIF
jgi:C4-dicarboxylate-specific signal transduction histidine kinase